MNGATPEEVADSLRDDLESARRARNYFAEGLKTLAAKHTEELAMLRAEVEAVNQRAEKAEAASEERHAKLVEVADKLRVVRAERDAARAQLDGALELLNQAGAAIDLRAKELDEAQAERNALATQIRMTVARLGGIVEGEPTKTINFLQRIDALRANETALLVACDMVRERLRLGGWNLSVTRLTEESACAVRDACKLARGESC
jgi:chromosome segregation ATPase